MIGNIDTATLQNLWWFICSVLGALFIFLTFVQGGQTLLCSIAKTKEEKTLVVNSLGRKWEITFTTLVVFGGAMFAAFPLFYATSFGGAYWVWVSILFTFIIQAVSYEFRSKPDNFLGTRVYDTFLFINGSLGVLLIGVAVGTFFTGSNFSLNNMNQVLWQHSLRGLEAAFSLFNLSLGLFLVFHARTLGALYLLNNIDHERLNEQSRQAVLVNFVISLPFLLFVIIRLVTMQGFDVDPANGTVTLLSGKYLANLLALPGIPLLLLLGLVLVILGVGATVFKKKRSSIWCTGIGTVLVGLAIFFTAGYNHTSFYPSKFDLASSLTIRNASSSHYTLTVMSYVALAVPFVVAYIFYFWRQMDAQKITLAELTGEQAKELY